MPSDEKSSGSSWALKPEFKFVAFTDTSPNVKRCMKLGYNPDGKSWASSKTTETWLDRVGVENRVKEKPLPEYITAYLQMGTKRQDILDKYMKALEKESGYNNEEQWVPQYLFPGEDMVNKKTGERIRAGPVFWIIMKRIKRVSTSGSSSYRPEESKTPSKGILVKGKDGKDQKDSKEDSRKNDKSSSDLMLQQLMHYMTQMNTNMNGLDMQTQIAQQVQLAMLRQQQQNQLPYMQNQMMQQMPFQDSALPINAHNGLPQAPLAPGAGLFNPQYSMSSQRQSRDSSTPYMNNNINSAGFNSHPSSPYGLEQSYRQQSWPSSRSQYLMDEEDLLRNTHLGAQETSSYPRSGAGSRRGSMVSFGPHYQEDMLQNKYSTGSYSPEVTSPISPWSGRPSMTIMGNQHMEPQKLRMLEAWSHAASTNSDCSDDERSRGRSYGDSTIRSRSRSKSTGRRVFDLSANGRRHSISNGSMHGGGVGLGRGFGMSDSMSEDGMSPMMGLGMMHNGMGIDRDASRTPFLGARR